MSEVKDREAFDRYERLGCDEMHEMHVCIITSLIALYTYIQHTKHTAGINSSKPLVMVDKEVYTNSKEEILVKSWW